MKPFVRNILLVISFILHIYDVGSDIALAISYAVQGDNWYFGLTLTFIILPAVITTAVSCFGYWDDHKESDEESSTVMYGKTVLHCCLLGVVYRYVEVIYHSFKHSDVNKRVSATIKQSIRFGALAQFALLETFFEAAPQLVLQLYIMVTNAQVIRVEYSTGEYLGISKRNITLLVNQDDNFFRKSSDISTVLQVISIISSLLSISWNLTNITKTLRIDNNLQEMSRVDIAVYFLWHLFAIKARVLAVALFAAAFTFWSGLLIPVHCLIVGANLWCASKKELSCKNFLMNLFRGLYFCFSYFGVSKEPRRRYSLLFFFVELIENTVLIGLWTIVVDPRATYSFLFALELYFGCTGLGFLFMLIYFYCCHPNAKTVGRKKSSNVLDIPLQKTEVSTIPVYENVTADISAIPVYENVLSFPASLL